ncbi:MAG: radical SAM protein, partial [Candidatus Omnitrophota bacterium]
MKAVILNSSFVSKRRDYVQITGPHLRIGVASVAAVARAAGADITVFDPLAYEATLEETARYIVDLQPQYLGLPAYTEEINDAALIAERVKEMSPQMIVIVGGPHATALPARTLDEFKVFDYVVVGEGEMSFTDIISGRAPAKIPGIAYREPDGSVIVNGAPSHVDLDTLPLPAWDLYDLSRYAFVPIDTIRGCPYSCVFCHRATGSAVRYKNPHKIVDDIEAIKKKNPDARFALVGGGSFPLRRDHAVAVCQEIIGRGLTVPWVTATRVDLVDEELLSLMKESGCYDIALGIESGDPAILAGCGKRTTPELAEQALMMCKKIGIGTELNFILGLPGETKESLLKTRDFALRMEAYAERINFAILVPFPGTAIYEMALKRQGGISIATNDWTKYAKQGGLAITHENFK